MGKKCKQWQKKLPSTSQSQTCTKKKKKKRSWPQVICCLFDPLQLSESWQNHYIWEVCSVNQWDEPKLQCLQQTLVNRKDTILLHDNAWPQVAQPMLQKLNDLVYEILPHLPRSPDLPPTDYHLSILTTFCRKNASTTSRRQKMLPRFHWIPKHGFLRYRNKQTYFSK